MGAVFIVEYQRGLSTAPGDANGLRLGSGAYSATCAKRARGTTPWTAGGVGSVGGATVDSAWTSGKGVVSGGGIAAASAAAGFGAGVDRTEAGFDRGCYDPKSCYGGMRGCGHC